MPSDAFVVLKGFFYPRSVILEMDGGGSCGSLTSMENSLLRVSILNSYELGWKVLSSFYPENSSPSPEVLAFMWEGFWQ